MASAKRMSICCVQDILAQSGREVVSSVHTLLIQTGELKPPSVYFDSSPVLDYHFVSHLTVTQLLVSANNLLSCRSLKYC